MNLRLPFPVCWRALYLTVASAIAVTGVAIAHEGHRHAPRPSHPVIPVTAQMKIGGVTELRDQDNRPYMLGSPSGRPTLLFFGFVSCPDACPTTLSEAKQIRAALGASRAPTIAFVTLDPARDTPTVLKAYMEAFDPTFIGLSGSDQQIARAAELYRVGYRRVPTGSSYTIEHSAYSYLLDESGRVVRLYRHGTEAATIVQDLHRLMSQDAASR